MDEKNVFSQMDFGPLSEFLENDDVTDISYSNGGQVWLKTLTKGVYQVERPDINNPFMEKLAFQCANVMGRTFNMAHPFLDSESAELRMNFVHDSIATNGIACLIRKTPAKIRLNKNKLLDEQYITEQMHDFLIKCVWGHCNIMVAGETGSGKTELVKYLASNAKEDEKIISIEDTLELHLDKIFPHRDIVAMKTNNIASYTEALVACMRQNPIWILLAEVRSAEAVMAVRNSISSGHHIISTIHADKASSIPMRMYALLEGSQDIEQYLSSIHRYIQIGIYVKGYYSKALGRFQREIMEVCEFYVDEDNKPRSNELYQKTLDGKVTLHNPTQKLIDYLAIGNVYFENNDIFGLGDAKEKVDLSNYRDSKEDNYATKSTENKLIDALNADGASSGATGATTGEAAAAPAATATPQEPAAATPAAPAAQPAKEVVKEAAPAASGATTTEAAKPASAPAPAPAAAPAPKPAAPTPQPQTASAVAAPKPAAAPAQPASTPAAPAPAAPAPAATTATAPAQPAAPASVAPQGVAVTNEVL
ncbi:MAG: type II/IV secretion system ATPase subunit [Bacilli bacterium]|nr:type II/IV secretion system ATPase subunit [Bacilli bacterium]